MTGKKATYGAENIEILEGLDAVRKRPGMYIGGTGSSGLQHLLWELMDNSVDEASAGHATLITVTAHKDGSFTVTDNGRGIPVGKHAKGVSALEVVFTELHAGGKFGDDSYAAAGGLHGVGASVVNALSSRIHVEIYRDQKTYSLDFSNQVAGHFKTNNKFTKSSTLDTKPLPIKEKNRTGTLVRFWPDFELFDTEAIIDWEDVQERCISTCFLIGGLTIKLTNENNGSTETIKSDRGLPDLVERLSKGTNVTDIITFDGAATFEENVPVHGKMTLVERNCQVNVAMRWVDGYDTNITTFVNIIPTAEGGTHLLGFERAVNKAVNDTLLKDSKRLAKFVKTGQNKAIKDDVQEGMVAVVRVQFPEPQFRGQTKEELGTPQIQTIVYNIVKDGLTRWIQSGKKTQVNNLHIKIASAVQNRITSKTALETRRKATKLSEADLPAKLVDCQVHGIGSGNELLIVEGDSAAGPAKAGRDSSWQAVLPLRGKVLNTFKAPAKRIIENAEVAGMFVAMGAGSGNTFSLADCRYDRVIILCDADVDGSHIRTLLLTLFWTEMREYLADGRVYTALPPLFSVKTLGKSGETIYCDSVAHRDTVTERLDKANRKYQVARFKGLGEMDVAELVDTALDPDTRNLRQLTIEDAEKASNAFEVLMGASPAPRRDFIVTRSGGFDPDLIDA